MKCNAIALTFMFACSSLYAQIADRYSYLDDLKLEMQKEWPVNRTLNIVFHGHSVPTGYYETPRVNTIGAYPQLVFSALKSHYPNAVINVITTSVGGEHSELGQKRFDDVLAMKPDVIFIDYALNDRVIGLERSEIAWRKMIESSVENGIKVILLTPTPDLSEDILSEDSPLAKYSSMIRSLACEYGVGLIDSYAIFREKAAEGYRMSSFMSQVNHPNETGHLLVASEILAWLIE